MNVPGMTSASHGSRNDGASGIGEDSVTAGRSEHRFLTQLAAIAVGGD